MDRKIIIPQIANEYIAQCKNCVSSADVKFICLKYDYKVLGYSSIDSMKSAVSKELLKSNFNKKSYILELVNHSYKKIKLEGYQSKDKIIKLIQGDLKQHLLKYKLIRDYLQELDLAVRANPVAGDLNKFIELIERGHSYHYSIIESSLSAHFAKKAKSWFINTYGGDARETLKYRRTEKKHHYLNLKDFLILEQETQKLSRIWTAIGFTFADGCAQKRSVQLVITKDDEYYLSEYCIPSFLDESIEHNHGPELITAHSNKHTTSYEGSKPVVRAHLDDSLLAAFLNELGMPSNKIENKIKLSEKVLSLPDKYFFCFLAGLFAGDGCFTRQKINHVHLDFDLHCEKFCKDLALQIESRIKVPMSINSHRTHNGRQHFKLSATTNWRAISLLLAILFYAPYHLTRKTTKADKDLNALIKAVPSYAFLKYPLSDFENGVCSEDVLFEYLRLLKLKSHSKIF